MDSIITHKAILYNDDNNTFDYVVACLIKFCGHTLIQAEQCALIAHNKGECQIASGTFDEIYTLINTFHELVDITCAIEPYESNLHRRI